ncbi:hypothetical protein FisN_16Hh255 [Fistulifera solaris]|uniref:Uncharacterized protein n=1 Tax=Fistulifera solaris TaxID=1519565 RepID=A0A1Z5KTJ8_FISSO|nr:hypothetical protein FisN_16Hh255 [Fistulifera solaris]|eukprot:GAX29311.1 hypothetical protein FisN_16Hh255 [Fistulifera solaris]
MKAVLFTWLLSLFTGITATEDFARLLNDASSQVNSFFVDSRNTYYDGYQQAWRYLGFYVDCYTKEGTKVCQRYLLWAAYVDLDYEGGGIGEYQYYNVNSNTWDDSACELRHNNEKRCAKMDCHLPDTTHWKLMGYFRNYDYYDFFEQLFKHEGYCIWNDGDLTDFMYGNYNSWPQGCTATNAYSELDETQLLYYDIKPTADANMTLGLYTDAACSVEYMGNQTVDDLLQQQQQHQGGHRELRGGLLLGEYLQKWNDALSVYKVCQPCRAYNLYADGRRQRELNNNNNANDGYFECNDIAGYTDVNQCMKFRTKTNMAYAPLYEVHKATQQGGLLSTALDGQTVLGHPVSSTAEAHKQMNRYAEDEMFLKVSRWMLILSVICLFSVWAWRMWRNSVQRNAQKNLRQPLVDADASIVTPPRVTRTPSSSKQMYSV